MKISILGSCVSRDIFRIVGGKYEFNYYARTSVISAVSRPLQISESDIGLDSAFQRKMVMQDFKKDFIDSTSAFKPDVVLIDFVDERFDLLKYGDSYVTRTNELVNGDIESLWDFERISRFEEATHKLWERCCDKFVQSLLNVVSKEKIYLHEAYWATEFIDSNSKVNVFDNAEQIIKNNKILQRYYEYFKKSCPGITVLSERPSADENHVWGKSPMHFTENYYKNIYNQLRA